MDYKEKFDINSKQCYDQIEDKLRKIKRYHERWYKTMALNLDFYNIPNIIDNMLDDMFETIELRKIFLHLNNKNNNSLMQNKVLSTIRPIILSLFIAWKSGDWCVRYSRGTNHLTNIKNFFYATDIDGNQTKEFKPDMKPYFNAWNRKFLNKTFNNLETEGFIKQIKGEQISKTNKTTLQTRVYSQKKLIDLFKKYESHIDINKINYLRNVESLKPDPGISKKNSTAQSSVVIRDINKKDITIKSIQDKIKLQFGEKFPESDIDKINDYYKTHLKVKVHGINNNYDIIKKHTRIDSGTGYIDENGYLIYNNIFMRRIFNNSSLVEGGRIYSNYQNDTKSMRKNFLINEENTKLFDMQAGQINILYHLEGIESFHKDAYDLFESYIKRNELSSEFIVQFRKVVKIITLTIINCKNKQQAIYSCFNNLEDELLKLKALKLLYSCDNINYNECYVDNTIDTIDECENDTPINILNNVHVEYLEKAKQEIINLQEAQSKLYEFNVVKYGDSYGEKTPRNYSDRVGFHTIDLIIEAIKEKHSLISKYFASGFGVNLQKKESDIVIDTILTMIDEYDSPILSVHDEIIVQSSLSCQAHDIFIDTYSKKFIFPCVLTDETGIIFNTTQEYKNYQNNLYKSNIDKLFKDISKETTMKIEEPQNQPFSPLNFVIPPIKQTIKREEIQLEQVEETLPEPKETIEASNSTNKIYNCIHDKTRHDYYGIIDNQTVLEEQENILEENRKKETDDINKLISGY